MSNQLIKNLLKIFGVAAAYYITGKLGLLLAIPPGYATAVWPPSGIALASVLLFGNWVWLGVFLGSCIVNIATTLDTSSFIAVFKSALPTLIIGGGASLQAILGAFLVRRFIGFPNPLNEEKDIIKFFIFGGPVSCLVNATVGVTTLCVSGILSWKNYFFSWGTWWVGDSIGVMVVTPIILAVINDSGKIWSKRRVFLILPFSLIFAASIVMFVYVSNWEQGRIQQEFEKRAGSLSRGIQRKLDVYINTLHSIESFYASVPKVDRASFHNFVQGPLARYQGVQGFSWNPRVLGSDRAAFEKAMRQDGYSSFKIKEFGEDGKIKKAVHRDEHIFPLYIEPFDQNKSVLGFDLASSAVRYETLENARDSGNPIVTKKIKLVQETGGQYGFLIVVPIYKNGVPHDSIERRRQNLMGFVVGAFRIDDFIKASLIELDSKGIDFRIDDATAQGTERLLYLSPALSKKISMETPIIEQLQKTDEGFKLDSPIEFAGRTWTVQFSQEQEFLLENRSWHTLLVLVAGLLFTGLFGAFLLVVTGRTSRIESIAIKRAEELSQAKAKMISSSKMSALGEMAGGMAHEINTPLTVIGIKAAQLKNLVETGQFDKEKIVAWIEKIESTTFRIAKIIKGLRAFARDSQDDPYKMIGVKNVVEETLTFCYERFKYHKVNIVKSEISENLNLECRAPEISQVILNLLNNAYDAIEQSEDKWISIEVFDKENFITIAITDSGGGIDPPLREKIMQPFFTTKPIGKGTGLGLSISKGIVESHNGTLSLDVDCPNTRFLVSLPKLKNNIQRMVI